MVLHNAAVTGSLTVNGVDVSSITGSSPTSASFAAQIASLNAATASLNSYTSSATARFVGLETATSSLNSYTSSNTANITSLNSYTSSATARFVGLETATASFSGRVGGLEAATASLNSYTSSNTANITSLNSYTSSATARFVGLEAATSSLNTFTSSINSRVTVVESKYATTGSNTFTNTQTITGSILQSGSFTSTGTITAQMLVVQTITSSVLYSSGSNVFGNNIGNTQTFTGSVNITGSLSLNSITIPTSASLASTYLQLAGGTLTGPLTGSSAIFSSSVRTTDRYLWGTATSGTTGQIVTDNTNNYFDYLGTLFIRNATSSGNRLILSSTGDLTIGSTAGTGAGTLYAGATTLTGALNGTSATFSGNLSGASYFLASSITGLVTITGNSGGNQFNQSQGLAIGWNYSAGGGEVAFSSNKGAGTVGGYKFYDWNGTTATLLLSILPSGAATFSSSVTAGGFLANGSTTIGMPFDTGGTKAYFDASSINGPALSLVSDSIGRTIRLAATTGSTYVGKIDVNASEMGVGTNTNLPLAFSTNASTKMYITSGGNVGIGTTNPITSLQIAGTATANRGQLSIVDTSNAASHISFYSGSTYNAWILATGTELQLQNYNNGSWSTISLNPYGGNVGIATSTPTQKLEVNGVIESPYLEFKPVVFYDFNSNTTSDWSAYNATLSVPSKSVVRYTSTGGDSSISRGFNFSGGQNQIIRIRYKVISGTPGSGEIFYTNSVHGYDGSYFKGLTLIADGNWHTLVLDMSSLSAGGTDWIDYNVTAIRFDLTNNNSVVIDIDWISIGGNGYGTQYFENDVTFMDGNIGIGTTSMDTKLHVYNGSAGTISSYESTGITIENSGRGALQFLTPANSDAYIFFGAPHASGITANRSYIGYDHATDTMLFFSSGKYSFIGGNVGIGTTNPTQKLEVNGNAFINGTNIANQFLTTSGTVSNPFNVWTTMFTVSSGDIAIYQLIAVSSGNGLSYTSTALVVVNGSGVGLYNKVDGGALDLQASGYNIQCKNGSGSTLSISYKFIKIS